MSTDGDRRPGIACPACGQPVRGDTGGFRCAAGHRYAHAELTIEQSRHLVVALETALGVLEDKVRACDESADRLGGSEAGRTFARQSATAIAQIEVLRAILEVERGFERPELESIDEPDLD